MKRKHRPRQTLLALALLLLIAGAAAAEEPAAFAFRNGITWETGVEQMLGAEGVGDVTALFKTEGKTYTSYMLQGVPVFAVPAYLFYYYRQEQLIAIAYFFPMDIPAFGFTERLERFTEVYGEPTEFGTATVTRLFNAVIPGSLDEEEVLRLGGWLLGDGTRLYMVETPYELLFTCFNAPALLR